MQWLYQFLYQFTFPPTVHEGSLFSTSSPTLLISCLCDNSHSNRCEVVSLWFRFAFPQWLVMLIIFSCTCWPPVCFHMCCFIPCSQQVFMIGTLMCAKSLQLYPTLCNPVDCSPLGSSVHGILQVILGGLPCPPPGLLPDPEIEPMSLSSPALGDGFFTTSHLGRPIGTLSIPIFQVRKLRHREMKWGAQGHTAGWQ